MEVSRRVTGGTELTVSVATVAHVPAIVALYGSLSEHSQRLRFSGGMSFEALAAAAALGPEQGVVAVIASEGGRVVAEARYLRLPDGVHDLVVTVADDHQQQGLGRHLLDRLREEAVRRGVRTLRAVVRPDNLAMLCLLQSVGTAKVTPADGGDIVVELSCDPDLPGVVARHAGDRSDRLAPSVLLVSLVAFGVRIGLQSARRETSPESGPVAGVEPSDRR